MYILWHVPPLDVLLTSPSHTLSKHSRTYRGKASATISWLRFIYKRHQKCKDLTVQDLVGHVEGKAWEVNLCRRRLDMGVMPRMPLAEWCPWAQPSIHAALGSAGDTRQLLGIHPVRAMGVAGRLHVKLQYWNVGRNRVFNLNGHWL